ncbi:MAG: ABC transporter permease [Saprospiraceae bacterium]|nr:ABC transporter permease [Saprospiraceae bacterium]
MLKKLRFSFVQAFDSIRSNFFHTFLSILGIVIGVAALVSILSLIDGMEKYAREQISNTTDLKNIMIRTETYKMVNNVRIKKDTFPYINYIALNKIQETLKDKAIAYIVSQQANELKVQDKTIGAMVSAIAPAIPEREELSVGRNFSKEDFHNKANVAIVDYELAKQMTEDKDYSKLLNKKIQYNGSDFNIIGVLKESNDPAPNLFIPIIHLSEDILKQSPPMCLVDVHAVENVPTIKKELEDWFAMEYPNGKEDFQLVTNEFRVDQVAKGFLLFRIIMGLIVGISVLVGGIGVMNVLLISVTERTPEIGLRKALGANRRDIMNLFLSESITISLFGSLLGLIFGILFTMIAIPIVKALTDAPFQAAYTWNTLGVITIIAILIGVIFGTYPAMKAARLDPVEAIRRE